MEDIDSWQIAGAASCEEIEPDKMWSEPIPDNTIDFEEFIYRSFKKFIEYPSSSLALDLHVEANLLINNPFFKERAISILQHLNKDTFSDKSQLLLLSYALSNFPSLLEYIQFDKSYYLLIIWCLGQVLDRDGQIVVKYFHEILFKINNLPIEDRVNSNAFLLLLQLCLQKVEDMSLNRPPFTSDEFEVVFCLAYCSKRSQSKALAASIVPQMAGFISQSNAAHLLFRRLLPYCSMENREGRKKALGIIESIISDYERFLPCISTWISLHRMYFIYIIFTV